MKAQKTVLVLASIVGLTSFTSLILTDTTEIKHINNISETSVESNDVTTIQFKNSSYRSGQIVDINIPGKVTATGTINLVNECADGLIRYGGSFNEGTFAYAIKNEKITGMVFSGKDVYELPETAITDNILYFAKHIDQVRCEKHPGDVALAAEGAAIVTNTITSGTVTTGTITTGTVLASKPNATHHIYLEFNGVKIQDVLWNGGKLIDAQPSNYTPAQIYTIWQVVSERYAAFNINVTTDVKYYNNAKNGYRQRVILTPTNSWLPGWGGYAFISSMRAAGTGIYSSTIPCFVFTNMFSSNMVNVGECVAHEIGHTLGLLHDGTTTSAYYYGQGKWAPIMGCAYGKSIVQFSKGEYSKSNNKQDDISIIKNTNKDLQFTTSPTTATGTLNINSINAVNVICNQDDYRLYSVKTVKAGSLSLTVSPGTYSAVDLKVDVLNSINGQVLASKDMPASQKTDITIAVAPSTYWIRVQGVGESDPLTTGYTKYGSIGTFLLTGTIK